MAMSNKRSRRRGCRAVLAFEMVEERILLSTARSRAHAQPMRCSSKRPGGDGCRSLATCRAASHTRARME